MILMNECLRTEDSCNSIKLTKGFLISVILQHAESVRDSSFPRLSSERLCNLRSALSLYTGAGFLHLQITLLYFKLTDSGQTVFWVRAAAAPQTELSFPLFSCFKIDKPISKCHQT